MAPPSVSAVPTVSAASVGLTGMRLRSVTGRVNCRIGHPLDAASLRSYLSGLTAWGWPTMPSIGASVIESL